MKILNREEFFKQPIGTMFVKVDVQSGGKFFQLRTDIMFFNGSIGDIDFGYNDLLEVSTDEHKIGTGEYVLDVSDVLSEAAKNKTSFSLDFDCGGRDGCFALEQLFAVFEQADIDQLIEHILPFSSKEEKVQMGLEEAYEVWKDRANGSVRRVSVTNNANVNTGTPIWSTSKGGRLWFDGELRMDELEALLVIGRHEMKQAPVTAEEKEAVLSVFEHKGNLLERVYAEDKGHFLRKTNVSGDVSIQELPNNRFVSGDFFETSVRDLIAPQPIAQLVISYGPPDDLITIRRHNDGELIVVKELNEHSWQILFRTNDINSAKTEFNRLVLETMALGRTSTPGFRVSTE